MPKRVSRTLVSLLAVGSAASVPVAVASEALLAAAAAGDAVETQRLLEAGAELEFRDGVDQTALGLAAQRGHLDVVRELLARGAAVNVPLHAHAPGGSVQSKRA